MINELSTLKVTYDPESGQQFVYLGANQELSKIQPESVIAYSPTETHGYRAVLFADGRVQQMTERQFEERSRLGWIIPSSTQQIAQNQQLAAVRGAQFQPVTAQPLPAVTPGNSGQVAATADNSAAFTQVGPRIRSIHIDIPREGQAFTFTKVLNVEREPLRVGVHIMKLKTFLAFQMCLQVSAFLAAGKCFAA